MKWEEIASKFWSFLKPGQIGEAQPIHQKNIWI
jgi:hypothetical protein